MTEHLGGSERELVLPPNSHAFILNNQKGEVEVFVGPYKANLDAKTDQPVIFDYNQKQFVHVNHLNKAINTNITAPEGWYLALKNPEKDNKHPIIGGQSGKNDLLIGKKINIKGPSSFALFPGQMCKVIKGHHLRSNQYLIVRIYDKTEAIAAGVTHDLPASQIIIDTTKTDDDKGGTAGTDTTLDSAKKKDESVAPATPASREVEVGQLMIIKGTEKSFYMPPTGVEVVLVKEKEGLQEYDNSGSKVKIKNRYVQDAVTLERLEYCVLLDEDGKKEYRMGPDVVFPKPTQEFIEKNGSRKFKAMSLNDISGIYIMVTNKYEEGGGISHKPGDELFITGKDTRIYYPREEHAIVKYDENEIHFATAVPEGEGRYVMDRAKGEIATEKGPKMLLPDPRTHVMIRRILTRTQCERWFPGNIEAIQYNQELAASNKESSDSGEIGYVSDANFRSSRRKRSMFDEDDILDMDQSRGVEMFASASKGFTGDSIQKKQTYTKPRTVTIDTKFEGAVRINVYQGYAVAVESKSGEGRIVVGPKQFLLDYHENLVDVGLSQHTPKSKDHLYFTPYLRVLNNKVSDRVDAETRDHVEVEITLSYIIDFTGSKEGWFDVENYVLFATERLGSMVRNMVKQYGIEDFYTNGIVLIRDLILGKSEVMIAKEEIAEKIAIAKEIAIAAVASKDSEQEVEDWTEPEEVDFSKLSGDRPGRPFKENGMKVSDVEIQVINVGDDAIADLLTNAQTAVVEQTLELEGQKRTAEFIESQQSLQRRTNKAVHLTTVEKLENDKGASTEQLALNLQVAKEVSDVTKQNLTEQEAQEKIRDAIATVKRAVKKADDDQKFKTDTDQAVLESTRIEACTKAFVDKFKAITPDLIAAMQANGDKQLALGMAQHLGPKAILGGSSLSEVMNNILKGTVLDGLDLTKQIESAVDKALEESDEY
jgi:major vault protein